MGYCCYISKENSPSRSLGKIPKASIIVSLTWKLRFTSNSISRSGPGLVLNLDIFYTLHLNMCFVSVQIVHAWGNQLVQELLLSHLILCIHNVDTLNICMKKFDAIKHFFDKLTSNIFLNLAICWSKLSELSFELVFSSW